jgi:hypothetical protein
MFFSLRILNDSSSSPSPPFSAAAEDSAATLLPPSNLALGVSEMVVAFVRFAKGVYSWLIPAMVVILTVFLLVKHFVGFCLRYLKFKPFFLPSIH